MSNRMICFRVDDERKARIEAAALAQGKSVTTFIQEVVMKAVERIEAHPATTKVHSGVPARFRGWCESASQGGAFNFRTVGYQLAGSLAGEIPDACDFDEWQGELDLLSGLFEGLDVWDKDALVNAGSGWDREEYKAFCGSVWAWFESHYPRMMALIPKRRREQFLLGVFDAIVDESISLEL